MGRPLLLGLACLLAASCGSRGEICDNGVDDDDDGFVDCGDQDCFASCGERCSNQVDDDGDGLVDCLDDECASTCDGRFEPEDCNNMLDDDGDTFADCDDPECVDVCDADRDGYRTTARGGNDCDDTNHAVNPGAPEVPYNSLDDDCNPATSDTDVDGDSFDHPSMGGADCDDANPSTFPGAPETCGDGAINDCDDLGTVPSRETCFADRSVVTADATLIGLATADWAGTSLSTAGDVNGDGFDDVTVGAYGVSAKSGAAYLLHGPLAGEVLFSEAVTKWSGVGSDNWVGYRMAGGTDLTGDGRPDVAIAALYDDDTGPQAGAVYVVDTKREGNLELDVTTSFHAKVLGAWKTDWAGSSVAMPGDVTGDGSPDLIVGSRNHSEYHGGAHIVPGPLDRGEILLEHVDTVIVGKNTNDQTGESVAGAGDIDADGVNEIVVGSPLVDKDGRQDRGAVFLFEDVIDAPMVTDDADTVLFGERADDHLGAVVASAGDINDDGYDDVIVGAPDYDLPGDGAPIENVGKAYLMYGPPSAGLVAPDVSLYGVAAGDNAGTSVAGIGDLNGDGYDDVAVGAPHNDLGGEDAGVVYVFLGPLPANLDMNDADFMITGAESFDFAGQAIAPAGDVDRDGFPDLLIGAPFHDGNAPSSGATYLFTFGY